MNQNPYFSIIIPTLNEARYLPKLLNDLTKQTNQNFAVIVVDGGSTDSTVAKTKTFSSKLNITVLHSSVKNVCAQRNQGATSAKSDWLLFMDADNRLPTYFIQGLRYQIDKHQPIIFTTFISPDGKSPTDVTIAQIINLFTQTQRKAKNPMILEALIGIQRKIFLKVGGFNPNVKWAEGPDLIKKLRLNPDEFTVFNEPAYTYSYRRIRREGTLKIIRNAAPLIFSLQTGIKYDDSTYQKLYPMLGGSFFNRKTKPSNPIEQIMLELAKKYKLKNTWDKLNAPIDLKKEFEKLMPKK